MQCAKSKLTSARKLDALLWRRNYLSISKSKDSSRRINNNNNCAASNNHIAGGVDTIQSAASASKRLICGLNVPSTSTTAAATTAINANALTKFDKLLIANRGEIACRIINTAKRMDIRTVAVYSTIDAHSKHVKLADEAICIGGPKPSESYMNVEKLLEAMRITGSTALHPGYGFLAENHRFVEQLERNNLIFVGPSSESIRRMGDKLKSKRVAAQAGVSTIPGFDGIVEDVEHCLEIAKGVGYPVMIKASAGGGGRGMRVARNEQDIRENYKLAAEEAQLAFGDCRLLLEAHIEKPRHIEIQILGDKYGNAVHLYERECSIQRRHQKIIEEAPSTLLDAATRDLMCAQAVALCQQIGYYSAGTVEFLVDAQKRFYFLEMNTRLQVEHPLTECITGVDLVEQMIRVAQGQELSFAQKDIALNGWALETRICAEDPYKNFGTPSTGRIFKYREPLGVRVDSGVSEGELISIYYDPLISKVIAYDSTRPKAIQKAKVALDTYVLRGIADNIPLLRDVLDEPRFANGDISTEFLNDAYATQFAKKRLRDDEKRMLVANAAAVYVQDERRRRGAGRAANVQEWDLVIELPVGVQAQLSQTQLAQGVNECEKFHVQVAHCDAPRQISIKIDEGVWMPIEATLQDSIISVKSPRSADGKTAAHLQFAFRKPNGNVGFIFKGKLHTLQVIPKIAHDLMQYVASKPNHNISKQIKAPMPGLMKDVNCKEGQLVHEGEVLCVIEAMKMQNSMLTNVSGRVKAIHIKIGDRVAEDDVLIELE